MKDFVNNFDLLNYEGKKFWKKYNMSCFQTLITLIL